MLPLELTEVIKRTNTFPSAVSDFFGAHYHGQPLAVKENVFQSRFSIEVEI